MATIIYTHTDEAPLLATYSFLPIIQAYAAKAGVEVETRDISLAGRILAQFPDRLTEDQRIGDHLAELGELATKPEANIIKLPNISASTPQLKAAIKELQEKGYDLPDYPENPQSDEEKDARASYDKVKGSAVNPVLREGNSDRRAPAAVKGYARKYPHRMGEWSERLQDRRGHHGRRRLPLQRAVGGHRVADTLSIVHVAADGTETVLKDALPVEAGEVVDGDLHERRRAAPLPDRADRARQGRGRAVLGAPEGHDDEGLRPDHLRPRRAGVLPHPLRAVRRAARRRGHLAQRRARRADVRASTSCPTARRSRPRSSRAWPRVRGWRWSTTARASPTCTCPPTSSSTPRCRR